MKISDEEIDDRKELFSDEDKNDVARNIWRHLNRGFDTWLAMVEKSGGDHRNFEVVVGNTLISYAAQMLLNCKASPWTKDDFIDWCENIYDRHAEHNLRQAEPEKLDLDGDPLMHMRREAGFPDPSPEHEAQLKTLFDSIGADLLAKMQEWVDRVPDDLKENVPLQVAAGLLALSAGIVADSDEIGIERLRNMFLSTMAPNAFDVAVALRKRQARAN